MNEANNSHNDNNLAARSGLALLGLSVVLGIAFSGFVGGWFGITVVDVSNRLPFGHATSGEMPRPRQGLVLTPDNRGQVLFGRYCDSCHPAGRESKGADLLGREFRRDFQNEFQISQLVREGTCVMPKYDRFLLGDDDLAEIAKFTLARAKTAAAADGAPPLPPLDGPKIMQEKCVTCHNTLDPPLDPRDPQIIHAVEVDMGRCAGITAVQQKVLVDFLLQQQRGR